MAELDKQKPVLTPAGDSSSTSSTSGTEPNKKRFNLRESLSEVKVLMEVGGKGTSWEECCLALHRHYQTLSRDYKRSEKRLVECQKKQLEVAQHRDVIQTEYARVNVAKGKLENLCRELQKHSKAVAEESKQRQREDEERRKEVSSKFQSTINDITMKMQEHHQRNQTLRQENLELVARLKHITEQYETREEHYEKLLKHKQLELQLCEAKMAQQVVAAAEEKENSLAERQYLLAESLDQQKKCEVLTHQEIELRGQLAMYSDKFEEFQQTLTRSNQVFSTFKKDTDRMSKAISALEKEVGLWKARYEKVSSTLLDTTDEKSSLEQTVKTLKTKTDKLERLCRAMQGERAQLREEIKTLEGNGNTQQKCKADHVVEGVEPKAGEGMKPKAGVGDRGATPHATPSKNEDRCATPPATPSKNEDTMFSKCATPHAPPSEDHTRTSGDERHSPCDDIGTTSQSPLPPEQDMGVAGDTPSQFQRVDDTSSPQPEVDHQNS